MKSQTTKKLFAFIIVMMFLSLTQFAFAQKKCRTCYDCLCGARGYGCTTNACKTYCAAVCNLLADTDSKAIPADSVSLSAAIPSYPAQSERNSTRAFDITAGSVKMPVDIKMQQGFNHFEWDAIDENGDALK